MAETVWATLSSELAGAAAGAGQSVVAVHGRRHPSSGIVWNKDSVVTANHALHRDEEITIITSRGQSTEARVVGRDPGTDIAVVRLQQPAEIGPARWSHAPTLRVGELVLALGRTWRGNIVSSAGAVSGLIAGPWRTWRGGEIDEFIRPDLTLYPGFSGGPLINAAGEFVGMNTAGLHRSGITIPAATIARVVPDLLAKGRVERPYLGLAMQSVPLPESLRSKLNLMASEGLLVAHVEPGSPADHAGILLGDVLFELAGKASADTDSVQGVLRAHKVGESIEAKLVRGGTVITAGVKLAARS